MSDKQTLTLPMSALVRTFNKALYTPRTPATPLEAYLECHVLDACGILSRHSLKSLQARWCLPAGPALSVYQRALRDTVKVTKEGSRGTRARRPVALRPAEEKQAEVPLIKPLEPLELNIQEAYKTLARCDRIGRSRPIPEAVPWLRAMARAYPAVKLDEEIRKADAWCLSAGAKGHKSNWKRFLQSWFARVQDRAGGEGGHSGAHPGNSGAYRENVDWSEVVEDG